MRMKIDLKRMVVSLVVLMLVGVVSSAVTIPRVRTTTHQQLRFNLFHGHPDAGVIQLFSADKLSFLPMSEFLQHEVIGVGSPWLERKMAQAPSVAGDLMPKGAITAWGYAETHIVGPFLLMTDFGGGSYFPKPVPQGQDSGDALQGRTLGIALFGAYFECSEWHTGYHWHG